MPLQPSYMNGLWSQPNLKYEITILFWYYQCWKFWTIDPQGTLDIKNIKFKPTICLLPILQTTEERESTSRHQITTTKLSHCKNFPLSLPSPFLLYFQKNNSKLPIINAGQIL